MAYVLICCVHDDLAHIVMGSLSVFWRVESFYDIQLNVEEMQDSKSTSFATSCLYNPITNLCIHKNARCSLYIIHGLRCSGEARWREQV